MISLTVMINSPRPIPRQIATLIFGHVQYASCKDRLRQVFQVLWYQLADGAKVSRARISHSHSEFGIIFSSRPANALARAFDTGSVCRPLSSTTLIARRMSRRGGMQFGH